MSDNNTDGGSQAGGLLNLGGGRRKHSRGHNRVKRTNRRRNGRKGMRGGFGENAGLWDSGVGVGVGVGVAPLNGVPHVEGMGYMGEGGQTGGHRCSMRHTRSKRTRKAHAGRKSRKHKSRGKKYGMGLKGIFGRS